MRKLRLNSDTIICTLYSELCTLFKSSASYPSSPKIKKDLPEREV